MKKIKLFVFLIAGSVMFFTCKKKELPIDEEQNDPQFYFSGKINGTQYDITAGQNNYYMYSSYMQEASNLYKFSGIIKTQNCNTCTNAIEIIINDHCLSAPNGTSGADSAFRDRYYPIQSGNPLAIKHNVQFYSIFNKFSQNYQWNFGDGSMGYGPMTSHIFRTGEYNVTLTVQDTNGCTNSVSNIQKFGNMGNDCKTSINASSTSTLTATFTHSTIGLPPYNFLWNFGDGNMSTQAIPSHSFVNQGRYAVSLRVIDAANDTAYANLNFLTPNATNCTTNYLLTGVSPLPNPNGYSNIVIKWTDANGIVFTSNDFAQAPNSYFKILKAEDYTNNDSGQKTKKLTVEFSCKVFNGANSMLIENATAIIAVAYK